MLKDFNRLAFFMSKLKNKVKRFAFEDGRGKGLALVLPVELEAHGALTRVHPHLKLVARRGAGEAVVVSNVVVVSQKAAFFSNVETKFVSIATRIVSFIKEEEVGHSEISTIIFTLEVHSDSQSVHAVLLQLAVDRHNSPASLDSDSPSSFLFESKEGGTLTQVPALEVLEGVADIHSGNVHLGQRVPSSEVQFLQRVDEG